MLLEQERIDVVQCGNQLIASGLTTGSGGNVSIFNREAGLIALSPSSISYSEITPEDVVVVNLQGEIVEGTRRVTTELEMHLSVYRSRPDVCAVVHTHSLYATAVSCMGWDMQPVHYMLAMAGTVVKCAPYATYGTKELADYAVQALEGRGACLLGNHGLLAAGPTLERAFSTAEHLEYVAQLICVTKSLGKPNILSPEEIQIVVDKFGTNPYK